MAVIRYDPKSFPPGFKPAPHVQRYADDIEVIFGVKLFGTYPGHGSKKPRKPQYSLDVFGTVKQMREIAWWSASPQQVKYYGIDYVIFDTDQDGQGDIFNPEVADYWRDMQDMGNDTADHKDHDHIEFEIDAPCNYIDVPNPIEDEEDMSVYLVTGRPGENNAGRGFLWVPETKQFILLEAKDAQQLTANGVKNLEFGDKTIDSIVG